MMIAERIQQSYTNTKYYQFTTVLEHVIDCFHTIVSDETNPYHPPLGWLTRKQPKPPDDELFSDLMNECSINRQRQQTFNRSMSNDNIDNKCSESQDKCRKSNQDVQLSASVRSRLERFSKEMRKDIVSRLRNSCSPLFVACQSGLARVVRYLIEICEADIEQRGRYETIEDQHVHSVAPVWIAAVSGHYDTVELLIEKGANVNVLSNTGSTSLRSVCFLCRDDDSSIGISDRIKAEQSSPVLQDIFSIEQNSDSLECESSENNAIFDDDPFMRIVRLLIENGANVNNSNHNGGTCLMNSLHNYRLTEYILNCGADINVADNNGNTALHYAIHQNRLNVTKLLLKRGADPELKTNNCDDALQLSCIGGHEEIFNYLVDNYNYTQIRLADAHKLLGSSILEQHYDIGRVRSIWLKSLGQAKADGDPMVLSANTDAGDTTIMRRRQLAFGSSVKEIESVHELDCLTGDKFRIQSLIISERILGTTHRETIQRLLNSGTLYINSMRPDRCLDLWIYALRLLMSRETIFNFESFLASRAIKKLLLDLISQQAQLVKFDDVCDVLETLILRGRLAESVRLLGIRPRLRLHEDIFDLFLWIIVNLLLIARCVAHDSKHRARLEQIVAELVSVNPKASDGSSLLHICTTSSLFEGEAYRALVKLAPPVHAAARQHAAPVLELIEQALNAGLEVDQVNGNQLSALQVFCLASSGIRAQEKWDIIKLLVERGAHVDRLTQSKGQQELIGLALREAGVNQFALVRLSCLAARQVSKRLGASRRKGRAEAEALQSVPRVSRELIQMH